MFQILKIKEKQALRIITINPNHLVKITESVIFTKLEKFSIMILIFGRRLNMVVKIYPQIIEPSCLIFSSVLILNYSLGNFFQN